MLRYIQFQNIKKIMLLVKNFYQKKDLKWIYEDLKIISKFHNK